MDQTVEKAKLPKWLVHTPLIDTYEGLSLSGTAEAYLSAIDVFIEHVGENINELDGYFEAKDLDGYTVRARALKSSARIIGAMVLSSLAAAMEKAGDEKNLQFIRDIHPGFIGLYRRYEQLFLENMEKKEKKELPDGELEDALLAIKEYVAAEDFSLLDSAIDYLEGFRLPSEKEELFKNIRQCLLKLDWDGIRELV